MKVVGEIYLEHAYCARGKFREMLPPICGMHVLYAMNGQTTFLVGSEETTEKTLGTNID